MSPWHGPLASSKGSGLWARILKVVSDGVIQISNEGPMLEDHRNYFGS